ncbi:MAG: pyridoxal phosphate-dependent aminotransferase [Hyphomicrobiales bacterium]
MPSPLKKFAKSEILSLTSETVTYDLAESVGPDLLLTDVLGTESFADIEKIVLGYHTCEGKPELRDLIARAHNVKADDVLITSGGMQALFLLGFCLCNPGDEVVITTPVFPNTKVALNAVGARVKELKLSFDDWYQIDQAKLKSLLTPQTKLVCLTSPQNPSGVALSEGSTREVLALMKKTCPNAYLIVDETYRDAVYGSDAPATSLVSEDDRVVSCASLSKCHGVPGLRSGWAITRDKALYEQLKLGKFNSVICTSPLDEAFAIKVLENKARLFNPRSAVLKEGLEKVQQWVVENSVSVEWISPSAGALCCVRLRPEMFDDEAVERFYEAQQRHDVRVAKGTWFDEDARVFRLGFGFLPMNDLQEGLNRLTRALKEAG